MSGCSTCDPRTIRCVVERLDEAGETTGTIELPLAELDLAPLDVVFSVEASPRAGQASALEERLLYHVRQRPGGAGDAARLRIRSARPGDAPNELFLADAIEQARALRRLFGGARPLDAVDLDLPERAAGGTLDVGSLEARLLEAETGLSELGDAIAVLALEAPDHDVVLGAERFELFFLLTRGSSQRLGAKLLEIRHALVALAHGSSHALVAFARYVGDPIVTFAFGACHLFVAFAFERCDVGILL